MENQRARSAKEPSPHGSTDPSNLPHATRTRKIRTKKKISIPLYIQQKKAPPETKKIKVVKTTGSTTVKT